MTAQTPCHRSSLYQSRGRLSPAALAAGLVAIFASPASAIECRGEYQIVQGQQLATPYCQDNYLSAIARKYGSRVSAREIRNNPHRKAEVCRFMGHDTRVSHICDQYRNSRPGFSR